MEKFYIDKMMESHQAAIDIAFCNERRTKLKAYYTSVMKDGN